MSHRSRHLSSSVVVQAGYVFLPARSHDFNSRLQTRSVLPINSNTNMSTMVTPVPLIEVKPNNWQSDFSQSAMRQALVVSYHNQCSPKIIVRAHCMTLVTDTLIGPGWHWLRQQMSPLNIVLLPSWMCESSLVVTTMHPMELSPCPVN
ncbi:unnamed protein product [Ixodes persulcatus]